MQTLPDLLLKLKTKQADFEDAIAFVMANYDYTPTRFVNGLGSAPVVNEAGVNEGACRLFALAQLSGLTELDTLVLFGRFYQDVLATPDADDHRNIRQFIRDGWAGLVFDKAALQPK